MDTQRRDAQDPRVKGFYVHATVFALVMAGLAVLNVLDHEIWWIQWPALGWGIGLFMHWFAVQRSGAKFTPLFHWTERT